MAVLTIKNLPDPLYGRLKARARLLDVPLATWDRKLQGAFPGVALAPELLSA